MTKYFTNNRNRICITYKYVHIQNIIQYTRAQRQKKNIDNLYLFIFI